MLRIALTFPSTKEENHLKLHLKKQPHQKPIEINSIILNGLRLLRFKWLIVGSIIFKLLYNINKMYFVRFCEQFFPFILRTKYIDTASSLFGIWMLCIYLLFRIGHVTVYRKNTAQKNKCHKENFWLISFMKPRRTVWDFIKQLAKTIFIFYLIIITILNIIC